MNEKTHKYLDDGRKVVIVGKLNSQETIVQEVFIKPDGAEIPSGENFVVKSLHDEPVESWADREEKKLTERIERHKVVVKNAEREKRKAEQELRAIRDILKSSKKLVDLLPEADLHDFTSFITGTVEYLVVDGYDITPPAKMVGQVIRWEHSSYGEMSYNSIKLVSVLGKSDGKLGYRIHEHSDIGGGGVQVYPFHTRDAALEHIKKRALDKIDNGWLSGKDFACCLKMGIKFSEEEAGKHKEEKRKLLAKNRDHVSKQIEDKQAELDGICSELERL